MGGGMATAACLASRMYRLCMRMVASWQMGHVRPQVDIICIMRLARSLRCADARMGRVSISAVD